MGEADAEGTEGADQGDDGAEAREEVTGGIRGNLTVRDVPTGATEGSPVGDRRTLDAAVARINGFLVGALAFAVGAVGFLPACGEGRDATAPHSAVVRAEAPESTPVWATVSASQIADARRLKVPVAFENSIGMRFVLIPAGTFTMGSPESEEGRGTDETEHQETLAKAFYLSIYETTNEQYRRFDRDHDSGGFRGEALNGDGQPAVSVSHYDATAWLSWLNGRDRSHVYALPTEAQWEYACRAGTKASRFWGKSDPGAEGFANVLGPKAKAKFKFSGGAFGFDDEFLVTSPVGAFRSNPWGLHDMLGNVWEWCADRYEERPTGAPSDSTEPPGRVNRVLRGGAWISEPQLVRAARRNFWEPDGRASPMGFRVAAALAPR